MTTTHVREKGATLLVALIILVMITLFALSAFTMSSMNLKTTTNMQMKSEAQNAAQEAIDTALSTAKFVTAPTDAFEKPYCGPNTLCPDRNGDGVADYTVRLSPAPSCRKAESISMASLDVAKAEDLACATGQSQQFGVAGIDTTAGDSLCSNTVWDITAEATSTAMGAKVVVAQGVGIRVPKEAVYASCL